jgi:hypothetical protein
LPAGHIVRGDGDVAALVVTPVGGKKLLLRRQKGFSRPERRSKCVREIDVFPMA